MLFRRFLAAWIEMVSIFAKRNFSLPGFRSKKIELYTTGRRSSKTHKHDIMCRFCWDRRSPCPNIWRCSSFQSKQFSTTTPCPAMFFFGEQFSPRVQRGSWRPWQKRPLIFKSLWYDLETFEIGNNSQFITDQNRGKKKQICGPEIYSLTTKWCCVFENFHL